MIVFCRISKVTKEELKLIRDMLCEFIPKETLDPKGKFYSDPKGDAPRVHCSQKVETCCIQACLVRCCCLRNLLGWGQMLPGSGSFLRTPSKQALMRNLMRSCLCIYVYLLVKICDENVFVMSPCCGGCQILAGSRMQPMIWWLSNPDCFQDAARKQLAYCRGRLHIGNGR